MLGKSSPGVLPGTLAKPHVNHPFPTLHHPAGYETRRGKNQWDHEQTGQIQASFDPVSAVSCYKSRLPVIAQFIYFSTAIRNRPGQFSMAAWWHFSWLLYLQARYFSTEVLFTHPHMSDALRSVHATSCSRCSPFSVVITHPQGSGWMCTA